MIFHIILLIILSFLLVQYDGKHFIPINHDDFRLIVFIWQNFLKFLKCHRQLGQVTWFAAMAWFTVKMVQITEIYPYSPQAAQWKSNARSIVQRIKIFLLLVLENRKQFVHFSQFRIYFHEKTGVTWVKQDWASSLETGHLLNKRHLLYDRNPTPTIK